jgi:hypothetical protein
MLHYTQINKKWANQFIFYIIPLCFFINSISAQKFRSVNGRITDSLGVPIEMAVVYANSSMDSSFIRFTNSNEKGDFSLLIPSNIFTITLNIHRLGYKSIKHLIALDTLVNDLIFVL